MHARKHLIPRQVNKDVKGNPLKKMDNIWECTLIKNNYSALSQKISTEFSNTVVPTSC